MNDCCVRDRDRDRDYPPGSLDRDLVSSPDTPSLKHAGGLASSLVPESNLYPDPRCFLCTFLPGTEHSLLLSPPGHMSLV
jgi:hypothetical protein